jgi:hypothetical protein
MTAAREGRKGYTVIRSVFFRGPLEALDLAFSRCSAQFWDKLAWCFNKLLASGDAPLDRL